MSHALGDKLKSLEKNDLILYAEEDSKFHNKNLTSSFKCHCVELSIQNEDSENPCTTCQTLFYSDRFIRYLLEKLKSSNQLKFKRIMILKG